MEDERGFFSRLFCADTFQERGLCVDYPQWSVSFNKRRGTLRGLHFQAPPHEETKLVSCTRGAVFDVAVDVRPQSPRAADGPAWNSAPTIVRRCTFPAGFAHGFQTLTDDAEVRYHISERYRPEAARGVRWDDPDLAIAWPSAGQRVISNRDQACRGCGTYDRRFRLGPRMSVVIPNYNHGHLLPEALAAISRQTMAAVRGRGGGRRLDRRQRRPAAITRDEIALASHLPPPWKPRRQRRVQYRSRSREWRFRPVFCG